MAFSVTVRRTNLHPNRLVFISSAVVWGVCVFFLMTDYRVLFKS